MTVLLRARETRMSAAAATAVIALTAICFGLVPLFARELQALGLGSAAIALYRYVFSAALTFPFLPRAREKRVQAVTMIMAGVFMGLGWIGYLKAIEVAPVAAAGVIYMSYPVFTLLFAWILAGQRPTRRALSAGVLVLAAAGLLLDPRQLSSEAIAALLWSLPAPISFGFIIVVLSTMVRGLAPAERMACGMLGAAIGLAPLALSAGSAAAMPTSLEGWILVASLGAVTALVPQWLYIIAAPQVGPARSASAGSLELPTMFAVGWLAFGEAVGLREALAAGLVLSAIALSPVVRPPRQEQ